MFDAQVDHVAIAVRNIRDAMRIYCDALGASFLFGGDNLEQGFRWAQFRFPHGGKIELVSSIEPGSFVERFIAARGEGVHHVTLKVPDLARAVEELSARSVPLFGVSLASEAWKEAFIHPRDAHGTLVQLAQSAYADDDLALHHLAPHDEADHRHVRLEDL